MSDYVNMTQSQFRTFRTDVTRAATVAAKEQVVSMKFDLVTEAARIIRNDVVRTVQEEDDIIVLRAQVAQLKQKIDADSQRITRLLDRMERLEEKLVARSTTPAPTMSVKLDDDGKITGWQRPQPKDGDRLDHCGEILHWWWGQWRRQSELEGFATWMARQAARK